MKGLVVDDKRHGDVVKDALFDMNVAMMAFRDMRDGAEDKVQKKRLRHIASCLEKASSELEDMLQDLEGDLSGTYNILFDCNDGYFADETQFDCEQYHELGQCWWAFCKENGLDAYQDISIERVGDTILT